MKNLALLFIAFLFLQITSLGQYGWFEQASGTTANLNSVFFVNNNIGWAVGEEGTIIHTTDGGNSWNSQTSNTNSNLISVRFTDDSTGYINVWVMQEGQILKTTNSGETWVLLNVPSGPSYFLTDNIGWIFHGQTPAHFIKTTDGGLSWDTLHTWEPYAGFYVGEIYFVNENFGFISGSWEGVPPHPANLRTIDGGKNWNWAGFSGEYISFSFIDDSKGWRSGMLALPQLGGFIAKTFDAGESWIEQFTGLYSFKDVFFINDNYGWTVEGDLIWCTINGGEEWDMQSTETVDFWWSVYFTDEFNGWVVGENGKILHTFSGGVVPVEEEKTDVVPAEYSLTQNFPNPFNPSTQIRYSVPQTSKVVIKVYDVLGNEIETLVNEEKTTGIYEIEWNAEGLPSGVYLYQLRAGSFVETKKMVLMK